MSDRRSDESRTPEPGDALRRLDVAGEVLPLVMPRLEEIVWTEMRLRHILRELDLMVRNDRHRLERHGTDDSKPLGT